VQGFDIDDNITCLPFADRFNNGLAGWSATFNVITHNNKDRCLFELFPVEIPYVPGSLIWSTTATIFSQTNVKWSEA
jgi:hypothetical protein